MEENEEEAFKTRRDGKRGREKKVNPKTKSWMREEGGRLETSSRLACTQGFRRRFGESFKVPETCIVRRVSCSQMSEMRTGKEQKPKLNSIPAHLSALHRESRERERFEIENHDLDK